MNLSDGALGLLELSRDLIFHRIPPERYTYYVNHALEYGRQKAAAYKGKDIYTLLKAHNIKLMRMDTSGTYHNVRFRAQFIKKGDNMFIVIYKDSMEELYTRSCKDFDETISLELIEQMHCAHEFFHYIEEKEGCDISKKLDKVVTTKFLFWNVRHDVGNTSEIAAHAFAKEFLSLKYLPNLYDYLYLMDIGKIDADYLIQSQQRWDNCLK